MPAIEGVIPLNKVNAVPRFEINICYNPGKEFSMSSGFTILTGNKFCLFNYATHETDGYVDFEWVRMQSGKFNNKL